METLEAMRTTGTCRHFTTDPVPDELLMQAFEAARFAPQGGNRQPVRWVVVRDAGLRRALRDLYLPVWKRYLASMAGPSGSAPARAKAADQFAETLHEVPVIAVVCAQLEALLPTDDHLDRLSIVAGASVYPHVQNFCLACRDLGVATALTTLLCRREEEVKELLGIPDGFATAAHVAVGFPARSWPRRLKRRPVEEIVGFDSWAGG